MTFYGARGSDDRFCEISEREPANRSFRLPMLFSGGELRDTAQLGLVNQAMVNGVQREFEPVGDA
jgi:hypothetical protein